MLWELHITIHIIARGSCYALIVVRGADVNDPLDFWKLSIWKIEKEAKKDWFPECKASKHVRNRYVDCSSGMLGEDGG